MPSITPTQIRDFTTGERDRMVGYYDKWYRYNRQDDGTAYDDGVKNALLNPKCPGPCVIIECNN